MRSYLLFRERNETELIYWSRDPGLKIEWDQKINEITPESIVGLKSDEGDVVKVKISSNNAGDFKGVIVDIYPCSPQVENISNLQIDEEVRFNETNLMFVFSVHK